MASGDWDARKFVSKNPRKMLGFLVMPRLPDTGQLGSISGYISAKRPPKVSNGKYTADLSIPGSPVFSAHHCFLEAVRRPRQESTPGPLAAESVENTFVNL